MFRRTIVLLLTMVAVGCRSVQTLPPAPVMVVDGTLRPDAAMLPGPNGTTRPLGVLEDDRGNRVHFVERELVVATDDAAALAALVARWQGEIVQTVRVAGAPAMHLVSIDPAAADPARLSSDLRTLDRASRGQLRVSSDSGLALFSVAASEAVSGLQVGVNWVASGTGFRNRTTREAPSGPAGYASNSFHWVTMTTGGTLDIGVAEAWRALEMRHRLGGPRIGLGVIDGGFAAAHPDYPPDDRIFISSIPFVPDARNVANTMACSSIPCPWHGLGAALTAMAIPDNAYGAAGPAGPVAKPIFTITLGDMFSTIAAIVMTRDAGAKIISMSFGAPIPAAFGFTVLPLDLTTNVVRAQGTLLFAAAANGQTDVDEQDCAFWGCWEDTWHYPCENSGVTCVGATNFTDTGREPYSNWGSQTGEGTVDIWAPGTQFVGMDRDPADVRILTPPAPGSNVADVFTGTSAATPFVAGVAALIWAADGGMTADSVEQILFDTARPGLSPEVRRFVHAYDAVVRAMGGPPNEPPTVVITEPPGDAIVDLGREVRFVSRHDDPEEGPGCCRLTWASDGDRGFGAVGTGPTVRYTFTSPGRRTVTLHVTDSAGDFAEASVAISVVNSRPRVIIDAAPSPIYADETYELSGSADDINEPHGRVGCERLVWSVRPEAPVTLVSNGCRASLTARSPGVYRVTLRASDSQGLPGETSVEVTVYPPPPNLPPRVRMTGSPSAGTFLPFDQRARFEATAIDPEGNDPVTLVWTVTSYDVNGNVLLDSVEVGRGGVLELNPRAMAVVDLTACGTSHGQDMTVTVTATDSLGISAVVSVPIRVECTMG